MRRKRSTAPRSALTASSYRLDEIGRRLQRASGAVSEVKDVPQGLAAMQAISTVIPGRGELRLDGGPRGGMAGGDPGVPFRIHLRKGRDVRQVDRRRQQMRLIGTGLGQQPVDDGENLARLFCRPTGAGGLCRPLGRRGRSCRRGRRRADMRRPDADAFDVSCVSPQTKRDAGDLPDDNHACRCRRPE